MSLEDIVPDSSEEEVPPTTEDLTPIYSVGRAKLIEYVKTKLGYPIVDVELTNSMISTCIDDALDEVAPWVIEDKYITVPYSECIDLSEYNVAFIIHVYRAEPRCASSSNTNEIDVFNPGLSTGYSDYGSTVSELERMMYYQNIDYIKDNISYTFINNKLYLDTGYPKGKNVTIRYSEECLDVDDIKERVFSKFLKDFAVAFANELLGEIRGKVKVSGSPVELDADHKYSKSSSELERLRQAIRSHSTVTEFMSD